MSTSVAWVKGSGMEVVLVEEGCTTDKIWDYSNLTNSNHNRRSAIYINKTHKDSNNNHNSSSSNNNNQSS